MTQETISQIPIDQLHESPFNPRKSFTAIEDLAANIKAEGRVHQPLLVRPRVPALFAGLPDAAETAACGFEVIFGHRRLRAAELAGLASVPCMVRAMNDAAARSAQIAENLQRSDVHPIEEAEGFQAMIDDDGLTADELVEIVGKSRSYVYGRLKLLQACPAVRKACLDGSIGSEVALLIARLRTPKLQEKALAGIASRLGSGHVTDGGKSSFRRVRDYLVEHFTLDLRSAIFYPEDVTLVATAGACSTCPKLSGNAPEFQDVAEEAKANHYGARPIGPNVCTDPDCFAAKKAAHLARKADELAKDGQTVITGNKAKAAIGADGRLKGGYVALKDVQAELKKVAKGTPAPEVVTVLDQRTGKTVKAVKVEALAEAGVKTKPTGKGSAPQQRDWEQERRERDAALKAETARRSPLIAAVRTRMLAAQGSTDELRLIAWLCLDKLKPDVEHRVLALHGLKRDPSAVGAHLARLSAEQLRHLLLDCVLEEARVVDDWEPDNGRDLVDWLCRVHGVDPDAVLAASQEQGEAVPA